jgi:hypothetical protein
LREIILGIKEKMDGLSIEGDVVAQKRLGVELGERIIEKTEGILKAVKDMLGSDEVGDMPNRERLMSATRRLQASVHGFESNGAVQEEMDTDAINDFDLGKYKGDEKSKVKLLFNLPNLGNISFDYEIRENDMNTIVPPEMEVPEVPEVPVNFFHIVDPSGVVNPSESVTLSASFQAKLEGHYSKGYTIYSSDEPVLSFTISAKVGRPRMSLSPDTGIDFGLVVKGGGSATSSILLKNVGSYIDTWRIQSHVCKLFNV